MLHIEQTADYKTLVNVDSAEWWATWEEWAELILQGSTDYEISLVEAKGNVVLCRVERVTVLARKANTMLVRPGYIYALGIAAAIPCGFMPVVGMLLYGTAVLGLYETSKPEVDEEHYNYLLDRAE